MNIIEPIEAWTPALRTLSPEQARELAELRIVRVFPERPPDLWRLEADSRVGVVTGSDWELRIRPRLAIPKLFFLLAYSRNPKGWKDLAAALEEADDVVSALATGFAVHAERALHRGLLHGYVHVEERRNDFRGRVRFADQLARLHGRPLPLEVAYDDFVTDILENRMLRTAADLLLRLRRVPEATRTRLMRIRALLEDVTPLARPREVRPPGITRLNERYSAALALAELVLRSTSISPRQGRRTATAFLFDMNEVFESFVTAALTGAMRPYGGWLRAQYTTALDHDGTLAIRPDITWWKGGRCLAVVDAKYKSLVDRSTMPNADAYQLLAYCVALALRSGYLIYAKESGERPSDYTVKRHGYVLRVRTIDVELEPRLLLEQVDRVAGEIAESYALAEAA